MISAVEQVAMEEKIKKMAKSPLNQSFDKSSCNKSLVKVVCLMPFGTIHVGMHSVNLKLSALKEVNFDFSGLQITL